MIKRLTHWILFALCICTVAGCSAPLPAPTAQERNCHLVRNVRSPTKTCSLYAIPSKEVEMEAKRFEAIPELATLYIVRKRMSDQRNHVRVSIDGTNEVDTIPYSFARIRLKPGSHRIGLRWEGSTSSLTVAARAGEIHFVEIFGSVFAWGSGYELTSDDVEGARLRASQSRLIADVQIL